MGTTPLPPNEFLSELKVLTNRVTAIMVILVVGFLLLLVGGCF